MFKVVCILTTCLLISAGSSVFAALPTHLDSQVLLGQALFQDPALSYDGSTSCSSCHQSQHAFSDPRPVSIGVAGRRGTRHAPSLLNLRFYSVFFWDGRAHSLDNQVRATILDPAELGFYNDQEILERIRHNSAYSAAFQTLDQVAPAGITLPMVIRALVAYEKSLPIPASALDRYLDGNSTALTMRAKRGLAVFRGQAGCSDCHRLSGHPVALTDSEFHSSGVGLANIAASLARLAAQANGMSPNQRYARAAVDPAFAALGHYLVTLNPKDIGTFRTPSLRNVANSAPYMHDGSVKTLAQALDIELYYRGLKFGHPILLTVLQKQDLLTFLQQLSTSSKTRVGTASNDPLDSMTQPRGRRGS